MAIITNQGTITYTYSGASGSQNATSNVANVNVLDQYSLDVNKYAVPTTFIPGENVTYQVEINNTGSGSLYNITLSDNLSGSNQLTYLANSAYLIIGSNRQQLTPTTTNPLAFTLPNPLNSGDTAFVTYVATVDRNLSSTISSITNTVTATANGGSTSGSQVTATDSATITATQFANVNITKSANQSNVNVGDTLVYTFRLTNTGNIDATGVVLTDTLPSNFQVTSITSQTGSQTTTWEANTDYELNSGTNELTLPNSSTSKTLVVPARTGGVDGVTTVTITGTITSN